LQIRYKSSKIDVRFSCMETRGISALGCFAALSPTGAFCFPSRGPAAALRPALRPDGPAERSLEQLYGSVIYLVLGSAGRQPDPDHHRAVHAGGHLRQRLD